MILEHVITLIEVNKQGILYSMKNDKAITDYSVFKGFNLTKFLLSLMMAEKDQKNNNS